MRRGRRLGIDVGRARVGVATCDLDGLIATPVETVPRGEGTIAALRAIAEDYFPIEIVVGLPLSLSGADTPSTDDARTLAGEIAAAFATAGEGGASIPVVLVDERMSTVTAQRQLRENGRKARGQRPVIDQAAAVIILQTALDAERSSGRPPGSPVTPEGT
ncbi:Holliday junction resolvase RuvX [Schumannella sp. 10F1B-5-1]|uniref:Holliday junction resolvase RuvX n=1 Tax=Schumannella sp. 10F1B-5-1 TaxID=2590780 RepID=UPI001C640AC4|nr:Holliday junction resolvase RuvX [Schumannella sp. 10F1B-5-1]